MRPVLDQKTLKALLHYEPSTGVFTWRHRAGATRGWNGKYAGMVAGFAWKVPKSNATYWSIRIFDWPYLGHRLAWLYMTGAWPKAEVDHHDLDGLNNRWDNLRAASKAQNGANRAANSNNKLGIKGVRQEGNRYSASFRGKYLGARATPEEAAALYEAAATAHFGQYARAR